MIGTPGADFHPNLELAPIEAVFSKGEHQAAYSGFEGASGDGTPLGEWLRKNEVDSVDTVDVSGNSNTVTYHSGSPKITQSGYDITVKQG